MTFGSLAEQWLRLTEEEARINGLGSKGLDRQRATLALIREIIGDGTAVSAINYDTCLHVRSILARLPANRTKLYGNLPIERAIQAAEKDGKPSLSPVTQQQYLAVLRDVLDLAAKKRLIAVNFAEGINARPRFLRCAGSSRARAHLQARLTRIHKAYRASDRRQLRYLIQQYLTSSDARKAASRLAERKMRWNRRCILPLQRWRSRLRPRSASGFALQRNLHRDSTRTPWEFLQRARIRRSVLGRARSRRARAPRSNANCRPVQRPDWGRSVIIAAHRCRLASGSRLALVRL
jgi:hypothetical protein